MSKTKIEWCDLTVNPVVGCSKCSPGCDNCYAERIAAMRVKHPNPKISGKYAGVVDEYGKWTGTIDFDASCLTNLPKKPKRIFVGSMCDLFHDSVMDCHLEHIMGHIGLTRANSHHTFILLTKRPERMREFFTHWKPYRKISNVILMVTAENQAAADERIPALLSIPGDWKRGVSVEPMLGPVDLTTIRKRNAQGYMYSANALTGLWHREKHRAESQDDYLSSQAAMQERLPALDWVICGGETGPGARPMHPVWAQSLRDQCVGADVPFFFKGWGKWMPVCGHAHSIPLAANHYTCAASVRNQDVS